MADPLTTALAELNFTFIMTTLQDECFDGDENLLVDWLNEIVKDKLPGVDPKETLKDTMDAFKADVGEEHFNSIANNPSLPAMIEDWQKNRAQKVFDEAVKRIEEKLGDKSKWSTDEIKRAILLTICN